MGLIDVIDHTYTSMGSRMIKSWLLFPLKNVDVIYFCDVMDKQIINANKQLNKLAGYSDKSEKDIHNIFDDKNISIQRYEIP